MKIGNLKKVIAAMHQKTTSAFVVDGVDLLLTALNSARKNAELQHDFNANRVEATISVSPTTGGSLASAVLRGTMTPVALKEFITFYKVQDDGDIPMYHNPKKSVAMWAKERIFNSRHRQADFEYRYPADLAMRQLRAQPEEVYIHGDTVQIAPTISEALTLAIDGVKWMSEYTDDEDEDWMCTYGDNYLKWAAVCEVNYFTMKFVPGLDGNLAPPERLRAEALQALIAWDDYQVEQGRQPRGIR